MHLQVSLHRTVKFITIVSFFMLSFIVETASAVNISAYRIYLDKDNRTSSFVIFNQDTNHQNCHLSLRHNSFDENGTMRHLSRDVVPDNSAKNWLRYSPREFKLTPTQSQTVRFALRRKANAQDGEYRSYLVVDCSIDNPQKEGETNLSLQTRLVHNIPIIVRSGKLDAQLDIDNILIENDSVHFTMNRQGTRSVYGEIEVINTTNNDIVSMSRSISIYPETKRHQFKLPIKGINPQNLKIRFTEDKDFGGSIIFEKNIQ